MEIRYPEIGICGLSCRLCPWYHTEGASKCGGCKSAFRMRAGCPFITCAVRRRGIEFCWECEDHTMCEKWAKHRDLGTRFDSFKCYRTLEDDIAFILANDVEAFMVDQETRECVLKAFLTEFNDGRSKSYYCIAATVLPVEELEHALADARAQADEGDLDAKARAKLLHGILDGIAQWKGVGLKLRK